MILAIFSIYLFCWLVRGIFHLAWNMLKFTAFFLFFGAIAALVAKMIVMGLLLLAGGYALTKLAE